MIKLSIQFEKYDALPINVALNTTVEEAILQLYPFLRSTLPEKKIFHLTSDTFRYLELNEKITEPLQIGIKNPITFESIKEIMLRNKKLIRGEL